MVYKEVGYPYMMMPDHVPSHRDDPGGVQAFAFAYGYIRALIQAVDHMAYKAISLLSSPIIQNL